MTEAGKKLTEISSTMEWSDARSLWEDASRQFAEGASGDVHVFIRDSSYRHENSIWELIEKRALESNANVNNINEHHF